MNERLKPNLNAFRDKIFTGIIGQNETKKGLMFHLDGYMYTHRIPHLLLVAAKGQGKTRIARSIAKGLYEFDANGDVQWGGYVPDVDGNPQWVNSDGLPADHAPRPKRKKLLEINCASIKNLKTFVNFSIKNICDKEVTLFFDELGALKDDVSEALLNILEPNETHKTSYRYDDYVLDFDFNRQSFIFATAESQKADHMLKDRFEQITLQDYTLKDLSDIVTLNLPEIKIDDNIMPELSTVLRGNGRSAFKMSEKIKSYLRARTHFGRGDWKQFKDLLTIRPLGLTPIEVQLLRLMRERPAGSSLTALAAKTGLSREQIRLDSELFLLKHSLMEITTTGRNITGAGLDYLKALEPCNA